MDLAQQHSAKLVLLGEMGSGKSSLVLRFVKGQFFDYQVPHLRQLNTEHTYTLSRSPPLAQLSSRNFFPNITSSLKSGIQSCYGNCMDGIHRDTAGQERYHSLAPMYYRGAAAAILVYDVCSAESFVRAKKWVKELQMTGNANMIMALAGNKCDLVKNDGTPRRVTLEEAQSYADENGLFFMETSAKDGTNVDRLFEQIAERLPRVEVPRATESISLDATRPPQKSSCC